MEESTPTIRRSQRLEQQPSINYASESLLADERWRNIDDEVRAYNDEVRAQNNGGEALGPNLLPVDNINFEERYNALSKAFMYLNVISDAFRRGKRLPDPHRDDACYICCDSFYDNEAALRADTVQMIGCGHFSHKACLRDQYRHVIAGEDVSPYNLPNYRTYVPAHQHAGSNLCGICKQEYGYVRLVRSDVVLHIESIDSDLLDCGVLYMEKFKDE